MKLEIPVPDKSNYLKGLLIIARKDNRLAESEKTIIRKIAEKLGFSSDFYEEILRSLLANNYIKDDTLLFSHVSIAESFVKDGIRLMFSDQKASDSELSWLKDTAAKNGLTEEWFQNQVASLTGTHGSNHDFALYSII